MLSPDLMSNAPPGYSGPSAEPLSVRGVGPEVKVVNDITQNTTSAGSKSKILAFTMLLFCLFLLECRSRILGLTCHWTRMH